MQPIFSVESSNNIQPEFAPPFITTTPVYGNGIIPFEPNNITLHGNWNNVNPYGYPYQLIQGPILPPIITTPIYCNSNMPVISSSIPFPMVHPVLPNMYSPVQATNIASQRNLSVVNSSDLSRSNNIPSANIAVVTVSDPFSTQTSATSNNLGTESIEGNVVNNMERKPSFNNPLTVPVITDTAFQATTAIISKAETLACKDKHDSVRATNVGFQRCKKEINSSEVSQVDGGEKDCRNVQIEKIKCFSPQMTATFSNLIINNNQDITIDTEENNQRYIVQSIVPETYAKESEKSPSNINSSVKPTNIDLQNNLNSSRTSSGVSYEGNDKCLNKTVLLHKSNSFTNQASTLTNDARNKNIQVITVNRKDGSQRYIVRQIIPTADNNEFQTQSVKIPKSNSITDENKVNVVKLTKGTPRKNSNIENSSNDLCNNGNKSVTKIVLNEEPSSFSNQQSTAVHKVKSGKMHLIAMNKQAENQRFAVQQSAPATDNNDFQADFPTAPMTGAPACESRNQSVGSPKTDYLKQSGVKSSSFLYDNTDQLTNRNFLTEEKNDFTTHRNSTDSSLKTIENTATDISEKKRYLSAQQNVTTENISSSNSASNTSTIKAISFINAEISGEREFNLLWKSSGCKHNSNCRKRHATSNEGIGAAISVALPSERDRHSTMEQSGLTASSSSLNDSDLRSSLPRVTSSINAEISSEQTVLNRNASNDILSSVQQISLGPENEKALNASSTSKKRRRNSMQQKIPFTISDPPFNSESNSSVETPTALTNAEISGEREINLYKKMREGVHNIISSMRQIVSVVGTDETSAVQATSSSSTVLSSSVDIRADNQEHSFREKKITANNFAVSNSSKSSKSSKAKSVESLNETKEMSKTESLSCAVCLEDYNGVLKKGAYFVAFTCGHVFCNICVTQLKSSKRCPRCRSRIIFSKIVRLYF